MFEYFEEMFLRKTTLLKKDHGLFKVPVMGSSAKKNTHATLYLKGGTETLQRAFKRCGYKYILLLQEQKKA